MSRCLHIYIKTGIQCTENAKKGGYCLNHYSNAMKKRRLLDAQNSKQELEECVRYLETYCTQQKLEIECKKLY